MKSKSEKLQKKLIHNTKGEINLWTIIAIVLVGLLIWQFGGEYLGYDSITDYLEKADSPTEDIVFSYTLVNPITNLNLGNYENFIFGAQLDVEIPNPDNPISRYLIDKTDSYPDINIITNAPFRISEPYYMRIFQTSITYSYLNPNLLANSLIIDDEIRVSNEYTINHLGDYGRNEYTLDLTNLIQDDYSPSIQSNYVEIYFYNGAGEVLFYDSILITKESGWF